MTKRVCENCRWWENDQHAVGACMRNPPQRVANLQEDYPKTHATDRCGEWSDASITPEQEEMQELTRRFALAILSAEWGGDLSDDGLWTAAKNMAAAEPQIQGESEQ